MGDVIDFTTKPAKATPKTDTGCHDTPQPGEPRALVCRCQLDQPVPLFLIAIASPDETGWPVISAMICPACGGHCHVVDGVMGPRCDGV